MRDEAGQWVMAALAFLESPGETAGKERGNNLALCGVRSL